MKKADPKKFTMDDLKDLKMCGRGFKYFKRRYGDRVIDLSEARAEVVGLIDEGKGDWVLTFCFGLMDDEKLLQFYRYMIDEVNRDFKGKVIQQACAKIISFLEGGDTAQEVQNFKKFFNRENQIDTEEDRTLMEQAKRSLYYGMVYSIESLEKGENGAQKMGQAITHLVEAYTTNELCKNEEINFSNVRIDKFKHFALYAMVLTEVWPND